SVAIDAQGERLIVNFPGTGLDVEPDWITPELLAPCKALLVDMGWRRGAQKAMRIANELAIPIILDADLSPDPETSTLISLADHVLFSNAGLQQHTGIKDVRDALALASRKAPRAEVMG